MSFVLLVLSFSASVSAWAFPAQFSVSPDNSQALLTDTVSTAKKSLAINIYMWTSTRLQDAVIERIKAGVTVEVLAETEPFGGMLVPPQKKVLDAIDAAIKASPNKKNRLWMMSSRKQTVARRYTFNHAKYVVVDGRRAYVGSENFVNSGAMADPEKKGNRGWQVRFDDATTAKRLLKVFREDTDEKNPDVFPYDPALVTVKEFPPKVPTALGELPPDNRRTLPALPAGEGDVATATFCASPRSIACIERFMASARSTLDIQHMSLPLYWTVEKQDPGVNPIIAGALAAAKRGVKVRILVNPAKAEEGGAAPPKTTGISLAYDDNATVAYLRERAEKEKLPLQVAVMNNESLQLITTHNKGMLADGKRAFVSSINGTRNSVENNRELAVSLESPAAARYYGQVFENDWTQSQAR